MPHRHEEQLALGIRAVASKIDMSPEEGFLLVRAINLDGHLRLFERNFTLPRHHP